MEYWKASAGGRVIAEKISVADRFLPRAAGLLPRKSLEAGEGLLLRPCRQVHTFFMRFPIDVLFLSGSGTVLYLIESMPKGRISPVIRDCRQVLELPGGFLRRYKIGISDTLSFSQ